METFCGTLIAGCLLLLVACFVLGVKLTTAKHYRAFWERECDNARASHRTAWNELWEQLNDERAAHSAVERERDHLRARLTRTGTARTAAEKRVGELLESLQESEGYRHAATTRLRLIRQTAQAGDAVLTGAEALSGQKEFLRGGINANQAAGGYDESAGRHESQGSSEGNC